MFFVSIVHVVLLTATVATGYIRWVIARISVGIEDQIETSTLLH